MTNSKIFQNILRIVTGQKLETSFLFSLPLSKRTAEANFIFSEKVFRLLLIFTVLSKSGARKSEVSFTS